MRRLYLLGMTRKEINACRETCDDIFGKCMNNPYVLSSIKLEKFDEILSRLNKKPDNIEVK